MASLSDQTLFIAGTASRIQPGSALVWYSKGGGTEQGVDNYFILQKVEED